LSLGLDFISFYLFVELNMRFVLKLDPILKITAFLIGCFNFIVFQYSLIDLKCFTLVSVVIVKILINS